jgi:1,4-dihydroxy-2-naphthoyl-CoA synthase
MKRIQKAAAAALALTITLTGATFAVAPMALADSKPVIARVHGWSASHLHHLAADLRAASSSARAG